MITTDDDMGSPTSSTMTDYSGYSQVELYPDGTYKSFVPEIETEWLILNQRLQLKAACPVTFFPNGNLESCVLASGCKLSACGVPILIAEGKTEFYEDGNIRSFTVAGSPSLLPWIRKRWEYRGTSFEKGTRLTISPEGAIKSAKPPGREEVG
jgi:hypothetical protein